MNILEEIQNCSVEWKELGEVCEIVRGVRITKKELIEKGFDRAALDEKAIENEIIKRDEADMNREISPLKKAEDAYCLDTSNMTFNEVVSKILDMVEKER